MRRFRTYHEVAGEGDEDLLLQVEAQRERLRRRLAGVARVLPVASGKGGVGKSALTANLAACFARRGLRVGALDADLNGPSLGRMLGVTRGPLADRPEGVVPPEGAGGVRVMSMELLQEDEDTPLRWRQDAGHRFVPQSTVEGGALREFLSDVEWGELDWLLVDVPPGTDKIVRLLELVPDPSGLLLVTTPSEAARAVVSRSVRLAREEGVETLGLVANMTEHVCPDCGRRSPLFPGEGAERLAEASGAPLWGRIPFDPRLAATTDSGRPFVIEHPESEAARAIDALADRIAEEVGTGGADGRDRSSGGAP